MLNAYKNIFVQITMAIAREVASVTRLGIEVEFFNSFVGRNLIVMLSKMIEYLIMIIFLSVSSCSAIYTYLFILFKK